MKKKTFFNWIWYESLTFLRIKNFTFVLKNNDEEKQKMSEEQKPSGVL